MHSCIFQISTKPIGEDERKNPDYYYDEHPFADYIGNELKGSDREEAIGYLADTLKDVFTPSGRDCLAYRGEEALKKFLQAWADDIKAKAAELTADNILSEQRLYMIRSVTQETHKRTSKRVHIEEWNGWAGPMEDLIEFVAHEMKEGDKIYVGSVIDYHF